MARVKPNSPVKGVELHSDLNVEQVKDSDLDKVVSEEAFFNESVTILIAESTGENEPDHVVLSVNGVTQPIIRGTPTQVKRKYVEVLAHMVESKYTQPARDSMNPEAGNQLIERSAYAYPFQVLEDKNPIGRHWLNRLMNTIRK